MPSRTPPSFVTVFASFLLCIPVGFSTAPANAQSSGNSSASQQGSSSEGVPQREKAPSLIDPAGPTISLISSEPVFVMAAALNACGYDDGIEESAAIRKRVRLFLPIISANTESQDEGYVFREWREAVSRSYSILRRRFIIPVLVDVTHQDPGEYQQVPDEFRRFNCTYSEVM